MSDTKRCPRCKESVPLDEYYKRPNGKPNSYCKPCTKAYVKEYYRENSEWLKANQRSRYDPKADRERLLRQKYGLTPEAWDELLNTQKGACGLCGGEPDGRGFMVDHDHSCCPGTRTCGKCVRGLLCGKCNLNRIGVYETWAERIAAYLENPPATFIPLRYDTQSMRFEDLGI